MADMQVPNWCSVPELIHKVSAMSSTSLWGIYVSDTFLLVQMAMLKALGVTSFNLIVTDYSFWYGPVLSCMHVYIITSSHQHIIMSANQQISICCVISY